MKGNYKMAINVDFNLDNGIKAARKLLRTYVNVGTKENKEWELLGQGIEDSSIETNFESETVNDILGNSETSVTSASPSQSFDPFTVRGGSKLAFMLHEIWLNKQYEKLSQFEVLTVYKYVGEETDGYDADIQEGCTITFDRIGGSAYVDMPITINYSDNKQRGTVKFAQGEPLFTMAA
jgi:hypothetical protein